MRRILSALGLAVLLTKAAGANPFDDFKGSVQSDLLKPFAADVGGLLGATDFHSARMLSFPGFDAGVVGAIQTKPDSDNRILNNAGVKTFGLPLLQVQAGLPFAPVNVSVRGLTVGGATIVGGGVKYGLYKSGLLMAIPDVSVSLNYDSLSHDAFKLNHWSGGVEASFNLPIIKPFVGVGMDSTNITVKQATVPGLVGLDATAKNMRYQVGVTISPLPLVYVFGSYNMTHGQSGYSIGAGARFGGII